RLVTSDVDVILAAGPQSIEAVRAVSRTVPIVGVDLESDPVARGWAATLARPGGNVTGFFLDIPELSGKQLQFLMEVKPKLARVAVLGDSRFNDLQFKATESAARMVGLTLVTLPITTTEEIASAIGEAARQRADALVALTSPLMFSGLAQVADHALKHRIVTICPFVPFFATQGGLLAYGPDFPDIFRRSADYIDRVLKGAKPGDLPIQRPIKFELAVNLKPARALNLPIPRVLLTRADRVIDK